MKVLFTPYGGGSIAHIIRSLAVADELKSRGHEILFTAPKTKISLIKNAGFEVFGAGHEEVNLNDENDQGISYFKNNHDKFINWLSDELKATESFQPDIIVNSPSFFGPLAAHKYKIPYVSIINAQWLPFFEGLLGLGKSQNSLGHKLIRSIASPIFARNFERLYLKEIRRFYEVLEIPYSPIKRIDLHKHNPALIPSIPEFEPLNKYANKYEVYFIGPLFWKGFEADAFDPLELFKDAKKPLVYVTLGGSIFRKQSYEELIDSLIKKKEWNILLSLGPNFQREAFIKDLDNFVIKSYLPGLKVCEHADIIINTASHGTVMQALYHGKPVVALPHNIDQATIGNRLVELNIGKNLNKIGLRDFTSREKYYQKATRIPWQYIINETDQLLNDKKVKINLQEMKKKIRKYSNAEKRAADLIEKISKKR